MKLSLTISFLAFAVAACAARSGTIRRSTIRTEITDHKGLKRVVDESETNVQLPPNQSDTTEVTLGDVAARISPVYPPPKSNKIMEGLGDKSFYFSIAFALLAVGSVVAKKWFPLIPSYAPIGLGGIAAALYAAPVLLDRYSWQLGIAFLGLAAWCIYGYMHNRKLKNIPTEPNNVR